MKNEKAPLVPLKKVCRDANVEPRLARRLLRDSKKRPGGRWAWKLKDAEKIVAWLKQEVSNANGH